MGGLPTNSPVNTNHRRSLPVSNMAPGEVESLGPSDDDDDVQLEEQQPRKRRKSQAQREEDEEYTPTGHMKLQAQLAKAPLADERHRPGIARLSGVQDSARQRIRVTRTRAKVGKQEEEQSCQPSFQV